MDQKQLEQEFVQDFKNFYESSLRTQSRFKLDWKDSYPCLQDKTVDTPFDRHYVYHTAWAARCLAKSRPHLHIDIGSSLYFAALVSAFVPIQFYDYRPPLLSLSNLEVAKADLFALPFESESIASLSCMHVVEHIGLGRYGDAIDYDGDLKAIQELKRVTQKSGQLFFVVPIGTSKIEFNAHRIYDYSHILKIFEGFELKEFALIPDFPEQGGLIVNASKELSDQQKYGCGCFWFEKK